LLQFASGGKIDAIFSACELVPIPSGFLARLDSFSRKVRHSAYTFCPRYGIAGHARLIGGAGVASYFVEAPVA
jgi:hypothetical protein